MDSYGELEIQFYTLLISAVDEVSGQLHTAAALEVLPNIGLVAAEKIK
jgi:hypothetical protein